MSSSENGIKIKKKVCWEYVALSYYSEKFQLDIQGGLKFNTSERGLSILAWFFLHFGITDFYIYIQSYRTQVQTYTQIHIYIFFKDKIQQVEIKNNQNKDKLRDLWVYMIAYPNWDLDCMWLLVVSG